MSLRFLPSRAGLRIGTQNAVLILPLFLFLALASVVMSFQTTRAELRWGYEEEAMSLALAAAAFLDGGAVEALAAGETGEVHRPLRTLRRWGQVHQLTLYDLDGTPRFTLGGDGSPTPPRGDLAGRDPEPHLGPIRGTADAATLSAFAPVADITGNPVAWLRVTTGAEGFFRAIDALRHKLVLQVLATLAFGLVLVVALTTLVTPRVQQLTQATNRVRRGLAPTQLPRGVVREINDLVTTFNTMTSVLGETVDKARRSVVDHEQLRTPDEIGRAWVHHFSPSTSRRTDDLEIATALGHDAPSSHWAAAAPWPTDTSLASRDGSAGGFYALTGALQGAPSLEQAARVPALLFFVEQHLGELPPKDLLVQVQTLFETGPMTLVVQPGIEAPVQRFEIESEGSVRSSALQDPGPWLLTSAPTSSVPSSLDPWVTPEHGDAERLLQSHRRSHPELESCAMVLIGQRSQQGVQTAFSQAG